MDKKALLVAVIALLTTATGASAGNNIVLVSNGFGSANDYPSEQLPPGFAEWCEGICFPTVRLALSDAKTDRSRGSLFAWGKNPVASEDGSTFCFDEYVIWQLQEGEIHTISTRGPCGTYMDRSLVPPATGEDTTVVAGGGQGAIVGGTRRFLGWSGTYATRVFVEDRGGLNFSYYDFLFVSISGAEVSSAGD